MCIRDRPHTPAAPAGASRPPPETNSCQWLPSRLATHTQVLSPELAPASGLTRPARCGTPRPKSQSCPAHQLPLLDAPPEPPDQSRSCASRPPFVVRSAPRVGKVVRSFGTQTHLLRRSPCPD